MDMIENTNIHYGDIPEFFLWQARRYDLIACDIETTGLDWKNDKIGTCQIYLPSGQIHIIQIGAERPAQLVQLLEDSSICKLFHHAIFDLRFMAFHWNVDIRSVACTKIASKILGTSKNHSLKNLLQDHLGVQIDKGLQCSDWTSQTLSREQIEYAASDVVHLPQLFGVLHQRLEAVGRWGLAQASFDYLPTRARLDIDGVDDVFLY